MNQPDLIPIAPADAAKNALAQSVITLISLQLAVPEKDVRLESHLANDLGADSLDLVELVMACEDEFGIDIPDETAEKAKTVQDVVDLVARA